MRVFTNEEAVRESGWTRGQIDQFISRWGYAVYGARGARKARYFAAVDMFNLIVAGQLSELGLTMPAIRDIIIGAFGLYRWDPETDQPAEIFPGQIGAGSGPCALVLYRWKGHWHCNVAQGGRDRPAYGPKGAVAFVIDASGIVERITALAETDPLA